MEVEHLRFDEAGQPGVMRGRRRGGGRDGAQARSRSGGRPPGAGALEPFGRFAEREAFHMKALAVAPNDPTVLTNASLFFAEVGRMRDALDYARQAYALDPMYPWAASWYAIHGRISPAGMHECRALWERFAPCGRTTS